jgi:hypothetical protein
MLFLPPDSGISTVRGIVSTVSQLYCLSVILERVTSIESHVYYLNLGLHIADIQLDPLVLNQ